MKRGQTFLRVVAMLASRMSELAVHLCGEPTEPATWRYRRKELAVVVCRAPSGAAGLTMRRGRADDALGLGGAVERQADGRGYRWRWRG
jgi:hypothetical protein